jgi:pimeloyl-ACP methyl ester carboxylesterase
MLQFSHILLMTAYFLLPPVMLLWMFASAGRRGVPAARVWPSATVAIAGSMMLGIAASIIYDLWLDGIIPPIQTLMLCYWAAGLICILKLLDLLFERVGKLVFAAGRGSWKRRERRSAAQVVRVILLFFVGLPYMIVAAATYRPKAMQRNESPWFDVGAVAVSFESTDGVRLAGLWTAAPAPDGFTTPRWGRETVILCPGARGGKGSYLSMATQFLQRGYNVLSFDFRGQGESDGQIDSFGDRERWDVLGAVRWLRANHPEAGRRIVGVGVDTGGAALLAAAVDPSSEGRALDALAVYGCYDRFSTLAASAMSFSFRQPLQYPFVPVAMGLVCVQTGCDLCDFSPARDAAAVAPRPIIFIQCRDDPVISFESGRDLYNAASAPKSYLWLDRATAQTDEQAADDSAVANRVRRFLDTATPMI